MANGLDRRALGWCGGLLSLVVTVGAVLPTVATAAPGRSKRKVSGLDESYAFVAEGDAALERGDYAEAIAKYSAAYYVLTPDERASYAGSIPVRNAMRAYDRQVAQQLGRTLLDRQLGFITEYLETVALHPDVPNPPSAEILAELEDKRSKIEKTITELSGVVAPSPEPSEDDEQEEGEDGAGTPTTTEDPVLPVEGPVQVTSPDPGLPTNAIDRPRPRLPIALLTGGGVTAGVGLGVLVGWWTVRSQAPGLADLEPGYEEGTPERAAYLQREDDRARRYLISGSVILGVGAVTAVAGTALMIQRRRRTHRASSVSPSLGPHFAGASIRGTF